MSFSEEQKQQTVLQIKEMFNNHSEQVIRGVCEMKDWDVQLCVNTLLATESKVGNLSNSIVSPNFHVSVAESAEKRQWYHLSHHGAIPKNNNNTDNVVITEQSQQKYPLPSPINMKNYCNNNYNDSKYNKSYNSNLNQSVSGSSIYQKISKQIKFGYRIMVIMRGLPGSGKSTLAEMLLNECVDMDAGNFKPRDFIFSTDDYFYQSGGIRYNFVRERLQDAHMWNQERVREKAYIGWSPIIVDNTNTQTWEIMPYVDIAVKNNYVIELLESNTNWRNSVVKLTMKNKHQVPKEAIQRMQLRYEKTDVSILLRSLKNSKYTAPLPQMRLQPALTVSPKITETSYLSYEMPSLEPVLIKQKPDPDMVKLNPIKLQSLPHRYKSVLDDCSGNETYQDQYGKQTWQLYEQAAPNCWGLSNNNAEAKTENESPKRKTLLDLLRDDSTIVTVSPQISEQKNKKDNNFKPHRVGCRNELNGFVTLRGIFINKRLSSLWDLFIKCNGSVDWAIDVIMKEEENKALNDLGSDEISDDEMDNFNCDCDHGTKTSSIAELVEEKEINNTVSAMNNNDCNSKYKPQRPPRMRNIEPKLNEVKQHIEQAFVLGDEHYSEHIHKIRYIRQGILDQPQIPIQLNENIDDVKVEAESDQITDDEENEQEIEQEVVEIDLGEQLVKQLCKLFGSESDLNGCLSENYTTNIFMPLVLAKQLHMLWIETVFNQMEEERQQMLKDDELFARLIKNPKYANIKESPPNVKELLSMELAWSICNSDKHQLQSSIEPTKITDIATHLTKIKLCEQFPDIPSNTLLEVYAAQGHNYNKTLKALGESPESNERELSPEAMIERAQRDNELLHQQVNMNEENKNYDSSDSSDSKINTEEAKLNALRNFENARNMAAHHSQLKAECYQKAREVVQRNTGSALFYSEIANLHKKKIDMFNHLAANYIVKVHKYTQKNSDLLDLHYLHVLEAISCLDLFLDRHIAALRNTTRPYKYVFIITGRGLHSAGGVSTIKNKVKTRLKERCLKWTDVNPGLLKVKVFAASRHTKNI